MRRWGITGAIALGGVLGGCAQLSGLNDYGSGDTLDGGTKVNPRTDADVVDPPGADAATPRDAADDTGIVSCEPDCTPGPASCVVGACNAPGGACTAAGQTCACTKDSDCKSGKCVKTAGRNDVACAAACTGTGAADGLSCALIAPGIPAACGGASFAYAPSNFAPGSFTPPAMPTTIDCDPTYNASTHAFTGWCAGQTAPTLYASFEQTSGPDVDILAFRGLTLDAGHTLTLTGGNPVILAVYGAANIAGVIDASAHGTTAGAGATACGVGASGGGATGSSSPAGTGPSAPGGGGAGLAVAGGTGDYSTYNGVGGNPAMGTDNVGAAGGSAHGAASLVPLIAGCPGGKGADGSVGGGAGGVGGGGVQLSVAGAISGTGAIKANGSPGVSGATTSPAVDHTSGGGGGGGGSGGAILVESAGSNPLTLQANGGAGGAGGTGYGADTTSTNTWPGTPNGIGGTSNGSASTAPTNGGPPALRGQSYGGGGGGGGGAYGRIKVNTGNAPVTTCSTSLLPAPACVQMACLCVADADCSSGKCVNKGNQCTGTCTGSGAADTANCQPLVSVATAP